MLVWKRHTCGIAHDTVEAKIEERKVYNGPPDLHVPMSLVIHTLRLFVSCID